MWTYGCNEHLDLDLKELPAEYKPVGLLKQDFPEVCKCVGVVPHPAFKPSPPPRRPSKQPGIATQRRSSMAPRKNSLPSGEDAEEQVRAIAAAAAALSSPVLAVRSVLLDRGTVQVLSVLLPHCTHLRQLNFSDCRLDLEMLGLLRRGLRGNSTVEALQIEWNPFELPLPAADAGGAGKPSPAGAVGAGAAAGTSGGEEGAGASMEARERCRYRLQSQRCLRSFGLWITDLCGGSMDKAWQALAGTSVDKLLSLSEFHDLLEDCLGAVGAHVGEVFDVLDGPDYGGGMGRVSVGELRSALEELPEEPPGSEEADPIGAAIKDFADGDCTLECLSLRACAFGWPEVVPLTQALAKCPWQLRSLNFWDNRICDRGARAIAAALEQYRGLEYLGCGRNRVTDAGLAALCKPFQALNLDEAGKKAALDRIKDQEGKIQAKAKAKAAPKSAAGGRALREPTLFVDELEERPPVVDGGEPSYSLRRPSELKLLNLSENPIQKLGTLEMLQPLGPKGAELVLKATPAAAALLAKRPDLAGKDRKPFCPGGEGWVVRAA